jgi:hypothetical protein
MLEQKFWSWGGGSDLCLNERQIRGKFHACVSIKSVSSQLRRTEFFIRFLVLFCRFPSELDGIETEKELLLRRLKAKNKYYYCI